MKKFILIILITSPFNSLSQKINFGLSGEKIINLIRALSPAPGAYFEHQENRYKIFKAKFLPQNHNHKAGEITKEYNIFCSDGVIVPEIIQPQSSKKMGIKEFLQRFEN